MLGRSLPPSQLRISRVHGDTRGSGLLQLLGVERDAVARVVVAGLGEGAEVRGLHHHLARTGAKTPAVHLDMLHGWRSVET